MEFNDMNRIAAALLVTCSVYLVGCQSGPPLPANAKVVTIMQNGSSINLKSGQMLVVQLERNPDTGFVWQLVRELDQGILMSDGTKDWKTPQEQANQSNLETQLLRFVAQGQGETTVRLNYIRPEVGPTDNTTQFTVHVDVE